jgi:co-chaperonin GroES (HSP10)
MGANVQPLRDLVLVERLDMGRERVTKGGIVIPATSGGKIRTKSELWRGRVLAKGPDAPEELRVGLDDVLVYTYRGDSGRGLFTGDGVGGHRFFVTSKDRQGKEADIICAVDKDAEVTW